MGITIYGKSKSIDLGYFGDNYAENAADMAEGVRE